MMKVLTRRLNPEKTKKHYKQVAWFYDLWSWLTESKAAKEVLKLAAIKNGETTLEVACGTGVVFEEIVRQNPDGKNTGIDLSPDMLLRAKKRLQKSGFQNYELKEGNVLKPEFKDNSFDVVINNFMLDLMPVESFDKIAEEFYRITRPNGRVVISIFSFGKKKVNKFWYWVAKTMPGLLTGCRPVSFKDHLIRAGFKIEKVVDISQNTFPSQVIKAVKTE